MRLHSDAKTLPALVLTAVFILPHLAWNSPAPAARTLPQLGIVIRLYNYARVDPKILARMKKGDKIFAGAGVRIYWLDCAASDEEALSNHACASDPSALDFVLNLLPTSMAEQAPFSDEALGFAFVSSTKGGYIAGIHYSQVEALRRQGHDPSLILPYVAAHELYHLFLGTKEHTSGGIMAARWDSSTFRKAEEGYIKFTREQRSNIQTTLRTRASEAGAEVRLAQRRK